jgi:hypothetical protein
MPRTDLFEQSAPRVEVDQRSRDARLRLEHVERLLLVRPQPKQSLLRRFLRCFGSRTPGGGQIDGRPMTGVPAGGRTRREHEMTAESSDAAGGFPAAPPGTWPNCPAGIRIGPGRPDLALAPNITLFDGSKAWVHRCGRGLEPLHPP